MYTYKNAFGFSESIFVMYHFYFCLCFIMVIADIHCHIIPYVDDGAAVIEEAMALIRTQYNQGIRLICATPHLRHGMFESSDEEIIRQYTRLKSLATSRFQGLELYLSREYHCDKLFREHLKSYTILPLGRGNHLLIEFSSRHTVEQIQEYIDLVQSYGYQPLIAHVERYPAVSSEDQIRGLIRQGAKIQVNAGSVLGREGLKKRLFVHKLLKKGLVDVVASDSHDTVERPCELKKAYELIEKKMGSNAARNVFWENPANILIT